MSVSSEVHSRDSRWNLIDENDPKASLALVREILRDYEERLSAIDVNGSSLVIPAGFVTQTMMDEDSIGTAQLIADSVTGSEIAAGAVGTAEVADGALSADATGRAKMADGFVSTPKIEDDAVTKAKLAGGFLKATCLAGGAVGPHTVTGIATGDELVLVARLNREAVAADIDLTALTSEFSITGADTLTNTTTDTTGDALLVLYLDLT